MEELIDIYDEDKNFLGLTVPREGAFMQEGQFMLYVLAIIQNKEGKFRTCNSYGKDPCPPKDKNY